MAHDRGFLFVLAFLLSIAITACTSASPTATPSPAPTPPSEGGIVVDRVEVVILESFPVQVQATVHGTLPDACAFIEQAEQVRRSDAFEITLTPAWQANARCAPNPTPFVHTVSLDVAGVPAGTYVVEAHGARVTFALATPNTPLEPAVIAGRVWHDLCAITGGEGGVPASPSEGCVPEAGGGHRANGLMEQGEPGIEGILVTLGQGECPSIGLQTTLTDADGMYTFPDLDPGNYCVSVDPLQEPNTSILVPGGWTAPNDQGAATVALAPGAQRTDVDLGWDYQFLPADALAEFEARLVQAVLDRDPVLMVELMGQAFVIAAWRSEGQTYPPQEAAAQLLERHLSGDASLSFDWERDPTMLLEGADPYVLFGPDADIVRVLLVTGWGNEGQNEAMLFIAQLPDGGYAWHGVLTAFGGFAPEPPAITWHREGGIAGFCDDLGLYASGNVYARSCASSPLQSSVHARLAGERLDQLETWVSSLASFEVEQSTGAVADAMTVRLAFHGAGSGQASEAQVQAMFDLASTVFAELWQVSETETHPMIALQDVAQVCPNPSDDARLLVNEAHGYCTLYPATHSVQRPNPEETVIVLGSLLNVQDARLSVEVRDAEGRAAGQVVEERLAEVADFDVERSTTSLGGREAILLEPVPGQDLSRQVFVTEGGLLYELTFTPADPEGSAYADMQALYDLVIGSWRFFPPGGRG